MMVQLLLTSWLVTKKENCEGSFDTIVLGVPEGTSLGTPEGNSDGALLGSEETSDGMSLGIDDGSAVVNILVGDKESDSEGSFDTIVLGVPEGTSLTVAPPTGEPSREHSA